jgi:hypothetical protein
MGRAVFSHSREDLRMFLNGSSLAYVLMLAENMIGFG